MRGIESNLSPDSDVDIHSTVVDEGRRRLVMHLKRERKKFIVDKKKKQAATLDCEVCGFSFSRAYGSAAEKYCEVHHLIPLHEIKGTTKTRMEDLAILCANCHRVVHLRNPALQIRGR
jgi:5-methylcytosine-specific restriction protein A